MTSTTWRPVGRGAALLLLAGAAVAALEWASGPGTPPPLPALRVPVAATPPAGIARSYDEALQQADAAVASADASARLRGDEWLILETLARGYMRRGRLTGDYADYAAAQRTLDRAFAVAPAGAGPHMAQAVLAFTMHRLADAERFLAAMDRYAVPPDAGDRADMTSMRGDIAFYRGDYAGALARYREAAAIDPAAGNDFRFAVYYAKTGDVDRAKAYFDRVEKGLRWPTPQARSGVYLQLGILELDRGRLDDALHQFRRADAALPGNWLVEEHIAETLALKGEPATARRMYESIVDRTGHPEFMDALAELARQRGDAAAEAAWTARARRAWEQRLKLFPEAAYGHAIDHFAAAGDSGRALDLARRNHQARPYGDSKIALAKALLDAGRPAEAKRLIEAVRASPWRTTELEAVMAALASAGHPVGP